MYKIKPKYCSLCGAKLIQITEWVKYSTDTGKELRGGTWRCTNKRWWNEHDTGTLYPGDKEISIDIDWSCY